MDLRLQRIAAWGGIAMLALFFVFFMLIAKLIPPLSPTSSAQQIADFLTANKLRVRVGLAWSLLAACVALPFLSRSVCGCVVSRANGACCRLPRSSQGSSSYRGSSFR
ncbi:MAG: hypothetical protein JWR78_778 [Mycobacterium sp.]|nr:hypothetical protein [Mycobacterium sp.]